MDLKTRTSYSRVSKQGINTYSNCKLRFSGRQVFATLPDDTEICVLSSLKAACRFGVDAICSSFSNHTAYIDVKLKIGRIEIYEVNQYLPQYFKDRQCDLIAHSRLAGVMGDVRRGEGVFPVIQHVSNTQINFSASAFDSCPEEFSPNALYHLYFGFSSERKSTQLVQKSVFALSQNDPGMAIVLLFASVEVALEEMLDRNVGRLSTGLTRIARKLKEADSDLAPTVKRLKRRVEEKVVNVRGSFAHRGEQLRSEDLFVSFEWAIEFFWYYDDIIEVIKPTE
jgi:hypothetical protein